MTKCDKLFCGFCPYVKEGKEVKFGTQIWNINSKFNCESTNIVYMIECKKDRCKQRYIGETDIELRKKNNTTQRTCD